MGGDTGLSVALVIVDTNPAPAPPFRPMMEVEHLKNIGPTTAQWLHDAGIHTKADLEEIGAVMAYKVLQHHQPQKVNVLLLYALQGALMEVHWNGLPPDLKARLKREAQGRLKVL